MSLFRKLAGQTLIYGISSILGRALNVLLTPIFTDAFPREEYGIVTAFYATVAFINIVLTFGMETTFFRFLQDKKDPQTTYNQAFSWVAILAGVFLVISLVFHNAIAEWMGYPERGDMVMFTAGFIFLDMLAALPLARMRHEEKAMRFASINLGNIFILVGLNLIFIKVLGIKDIRLIFLVNLIASFVRTLMAWVGNMPTKFLPKFQEMGGMLRYGFFIMIAGLAGTVNETFDRFYIPRRWPDDGVFQGLEMSGDAMNGIYGANYKVAMLIMLFTQAYRYAVEPFFFKEAKEKDSPLTFSKIFHYFTLAVLFGFLVLASFAQEIVSFDLTFGLSDTPFTLINENYWSGLQVVPILLMAYVFSSMYINISIWFKITKQTSFALLFTGVGAAITLLINFLGIPLYGYLASAWATLACYLVMVALVYFVGQVHYPVPYKMLRMLLYTGLFLVGYILNVDVGPVAGSFTAFLMKAGTCLLIPAIIYVIENYWPSFVKGEEQGLGE